MQHFSFGCDFEIKGSVATQKDNARTFKGFGAAFGNIDSYGDVIAKGAFAKTIKAAKSGTGQYPAMLLQHGGPSSADKTPVGIWLELDMPIAEDGSTCQILYD